MDEKKYFQVIDPDQRGAIAAAAPTCLYLEVTNEELVVSFRHRRTPAH